ncbi:GNAT family N-acetyltransferase [Streptomyces sp. NPDC003077]|uniref:GNAT family N-acetyltransferase n=1 Tax=Streptomyces sp. NPDC003077 TaxID=3154443 RepID=UPI0033A346D7
MKPLCASQQSRTESRKPASDAAAGSGGFTVVAATLEEWTQVAEWANEEGWNVGVNDVRCFHPTDPDGFFIGRIGSRPVSALSVVNYSDRYAFAGHYLVPEAYRGLGLGLALWEAALPHAGTRTVGLDAMPAQQANYEKSGFFPVYDTYRYSGRFERPGAVAPGTVRVGPRDLDAVAAYDRTYFPADRRAFLSRWLAAPGHRAYARLTDGRITGYGVIRPAHRGHRIGPLFAETPHDTEALFDSLTAHLGPDEEVSLDVPEPQRAAGALVRERGLRQEFRTVRMYTGPVPGSRAECAGAITSLELG